MKPTLKWKNGRCTNPPPEWCVEAISRVNGTWVVWVQQSRSNVVLASHSTYEWPSQEAAQGACEVALWRLGVLPLPVWQPIDEPAMQARLGWWHTEAVAGLHATATDFDGRWCVWRDGGLVANGGGPGPDPCPPRYAMVQAENVLRALIAAALEGGA